MTLIILDRDGVINEDSDDYIKSVNEWRPLPGSIDAIARLSKAGYTVAVATNQSGISRGYFDEVELALMHQKMCDLVEESGGHIAGVFYCPHGPEDGCHCRKPKTGLLEQIACEFGVSVEGCPFIGDSAKDLLCAKVAGCLPVLVKTGKGSATIAESSADELDGVRVVEDLAAYVDAILGSDSPQ